MATAAYFSTRAHVPEIVLAFDVFPSPVPALLPVRQDGRLSIFFIFFAYFNGFSGCSTPRPQITRTKCKSA